MGEVIVLFVIPVPGLSEHDGYVLAGVFLLEALRIEDIVIVLYAAILAHLEMVDIDIGMDIVSVSMVISVEITSEEAVGLAIVIAPSIGIIDFEAQSACLVDIRSEVSSHPVLSVLAVATFVVSQVGDRALGVGKAEVAQGSAKEAERLQKDELV